jgi:hypothetical protein
MPIYSPTGFLDITNATLRTSNTECQNLQIGSGNVYVTTDLTSNLVLNLENITNLGNSTSNTMRFINTTTGLTVASNALVTGNVTAGSFIGDGSGLTSIPPSAITGTLSQWSDGTNSDVYIASNVGIGNVHTLTSNTLQVGANLYVRDADANVLTVTGNVAATYFEGDGSKLTGISSTLQAITTAQATTTDTVSFLNATTGFTVASNILVTGNVTAGSFMGDGSGLTGISSTLQAITDGGNVTSNVVQFSNATTGLVTTANIEVGGDLKIDGLTAGTVPYVDTDKFLKNSFISMTGDTTVITSNLDVTGNIFMRGDRFVVESETKLINDAIIGIANNNVSSATDIGILMQRPDANVAIIHHGGTNELSFAYTQNDLEATDITNDLSKELTINVVGHVITQNNLTVGGTLKLNTITAAATHSLQAVTGVGSVTSNTVQFSNATTSLTADSNILVTGNVTAATFLGDGSGLTALPAAEITGTLTVANGGTGVVQKTGTGSLVLSDTPTFTGTVTAVTFSGSGSGLTALPAAEITGTLAVANGGTGVTGSTGTGDVVLSIAPAFSGNVTVDTNTLFVDSTNNRVGVGTDSPSSKLTVNQIPEHRSSYDHSLAPMTITNRTVTSNTILNDPKHVLNLAREGTSGEAYGANATFKLSRWENNGLNSRTRLDLNLAHASYDEQHIMTFRSDGNVGIGTTDPSSSLHVNLGNAAGEQHIRATQTSLASSSKAGIRFGDSTWDAFIDHDHGDKDRMNFGFYRNPTREVQMVLTHEGNVGIGTTGPGRKLDVRTGDIRYGDGVADYDIFAAVLDYGGITVNDGGGGNIAYNISTGNSTESWCWRFVDGTAKGPGTDYFRVEYSSGNYYHKGTAISDRRTKTNFVSIDGVDALNSITKLNPLVYNDKSSNGEIDNRLKGGFIAQEVLDVIPHLVGYDEDRDKPNENGYATAYALDYNGVFAYNVKATQEIYKLLLIEQTKVTNLEARILALENA